LTWHIIESDLAKKNYLERGFKARAERMSNQFRTELGLEFNDPLCGFELAKHLDIEVISPEILGLDNQELNVLMGNQEESSGWSALTMTDHNNKRLIIHNTRASKARQQSDLMHELSHIICKHEIVVPEGVILPSYMRYYNKTQEAEAEYLGSALQLPRECLVWALTTGNMSKMGVATNYTASLKMVNYRINSTGIRRQLKYIKP
jgi:Zn-dependent peptidase ImmA (M78 family)